MTTPWRDVKRDTFAPHPRHPRAVPPGIRRQADRAGGYGVYLDRLRIAAWAFGSSGMLPPSYTRRVGVNPDRHARIRMRHFHYAIGATCIRPWPELDGHFKAFRNCDWGCR